LLGDEDFDGSGDAGLTADETGAFEGEDHLMGRWGADAEVSLQVSLGGRAPKHM
jgi:hypothetical protein